MFLFQFLFQFVHGQTHLGTMSVQWYGSRNCEVLSPARARLIGGVSPAISTAPVKMNSITTEKRIGVSSYGTGCLPLVFLFVDDGFAWRGGIAGLRGLGASMGSAAQLCLQRERSLIRARHSTSIKVNAK